MTPFLSSLSSRGKAGRVSLGSVIGFVLFLAAAFLLQRSLRHYSWSEIVAELHRQRAANLWLAGLCSLMNYAALIFYELFAFEALKKPMSVMRVSGASFVANAFGHTLGFPAFTGAALRYRFYTHWGLSGWHVAEITTLTYLPATFGFLLMTGAAFSLFPMPLPPAIHLPTSSLRWLGIAMLACVIAYLAAVLWRRRPIRVRAFVLPMPSFGIAIAQLTAGVIKWTMAGILLYVLLSGWHYVPPGRFLTIYCLAQTAAILTHTPGGLGVFDATLLLLLKSAIDPPVLASALLLYRLLYNLIPLAVASPVYAIFEWHRRRHAPLAAKAEGIA